MLPQPLDLEHPRLFKDIIADLNREIADVSAETGEDFSFCWWNEKLPESVPIRWKWWACFAVRGGSEGYWVHIELIDAEKDARALIALCKVWSWDHALKLANAATLVLHR